MTYGSESGQRTAESGGLCRIAVFMMGSIYDVISVKRETKDLVSRIMEELRKEKPTLTYDEMVKQAVEQMFINKRMNDELRKIR